MATWMPTLVDAPLRGTRDCGASVVHDAMDAVERGSSREGNTLMADTRRDGARSIRTFDTTRQRRRSGDARVERVQVM